MNYYRAYDYGCKQDEELQVAIPRTQNPYDMDD
jgi:hypothetical protein